MGTKKAAKQMESEPRLVRVFFYGTFMNPAVLAAHGVTAKNVLAARVAGFEIYIRPRVNLVSREGACVYGSVVSVMHEDLDKIYLALEEKFGLRYLPEAVLAEAMEGFPKTEPALCYIAPRMTASPPHPEYVKELAECVRLLNLPESYARTIESFVSEGTT